MATTAAILDILIKTDTSKATTELRQLDQKMSQAATGSKRLTDAQRRQGSAFAGSTRSLQSYGDRASRVSRNNDLLHRSSTRLGGALKTAAGAAAGAAAAYLSIAQAKEAISTTEDLASATIALKKNFALSIKTASGLSAAFLARGGETSGLSTSFIMLSKQVEAARSTMEGFDAAKKMIKDPSSEKGAKNLAEAIKGVDADAAVSAFRDLGISVKDLQTQSPDKTLFQISDGFEKLGNSTRRTVIASQLFGRTASKELIPALRGGAADLREQIALAEKYGATFRGKPIQSIKDLSAAQRELQIAQLGWQVQFTEKIAPALVKVGLAFAKFTNDMRTGKGVAGDVADALRTFGKILEFLGPIAKVQGQLMWKFLFKPIITGAKAVVDATHWIIDAFNNVRDFFAGGGWGKIGAAIAAPFKWALDKIKGFVNDIIGVINTVLGPVGVHIGEVGGGGGGAAPVGGKAIHAHPNTKKRQRGGGIGGAGSGDKVPALLEPGEFVLNRNAVAAVGMRELEKFNGNVSRFQAGGAAAGIGGAITGAGSKIAGAVGGGVSAAVGKLPGTSSLPGWVKPVGDFVLAKVGAFIKDKLTPSFGGGGPGILPGGGGTGTQRIEAVGRWLQGRGFQVSGERIFGGTPTTGHVPGSMHYSNRAIDVNWPNAAKEPAHLIPLFNQLAAGTPRPTELFYQNRGIPSPVPNHYDHLHLGYQKGGGVPRPAHGSHWIKGGGNWSVDEAATLLWQAGLSARYAKQLARVVPAESGGNPRAHNPSGATGLFQILGAVVPGNLYDPRINALNAVKKFKDAGNSLSPWVGAPSGPVPNLLLDAIGSNGGGAADAAGGTGKEKFQSAFPGISLRLLQRLHRSLKGPAQRKLQEGVHTARVALGNAKGPAARITAIQGLNAAKGAKTGYLGALATYQKSRKSGTGVRKALEALVTMEQALTAAPEAGDLGEADTSALDTENERIRAMNELISQGNLLALQGFQVSASQNPLLGMSSDRFPTQTPLSPLLTSLSGGAAGAPGGAAGKTSRQYTPVHVHIHSKKKGVRLEDLIDVRIQGQMKKSARKGNRRLPSGRGA